jgi:hypothetical protein
MVGFLPGVVVDPAEQFDRVVVPRPPEIPGDFEQRGEAVGKRG